MKKNIMMRVASALLIAVLLTTCAISGTFAKYVTSASGNDVARVAKWGFGTTTLAVDMFDGTYNNVASGDSANVVAPGTTKTATIELIPAEQGTPEVQYTFNADVTAVGSSTDLLAKLKWKLNDGSFGTFAELQSAVNTLFDRTYAAGELPTKTITITWEWPFNENDSDASATDTLFGNDGTLTLNIVFAFTATQED